MVNLMKYREVADYPDGRASTISGQEADDLYAPIDILAEIGAKPVFFGDVDQQLLGDAPIWDRVAVVKYATRHVSRGSRRVKTRREGRRMVFGRGHDRR